MDYLASINCKDKSVSAIWTNTSVQTKRLLAGWARLHYGRCRLSVLWVSTIHCITFANLKSIAYHNQLVRTRSRTARTWKTTWGSQQPARLPSRAMLSTPMRETWDQSRIEHRKSARGTQETCRMREKVSQIGNSGYILFYEYFHGDKGRVWGPAIKPDGRGLWHTRWIHSRVCPRRTHSRLPGQSFSAG